MATVSPAAQGGAGLSREELDGVLVTAEGEILPRDVDSRDAETMGIEAAEEAEEEEKEGDEAMEESAVRARRSPKEPT